MMTVKIIDSEYIDKEIQTTFGSIPERQKTGITVRFEDLESQENIYRAEMLVHVINEMVNRNEVLRVSFPLEKKKKRRKK